MSCCNFFSTGVAAAKLQHAETGLLAADTVVTKRGVVPRGIATSIAPANGMLPERDEISL